MTIIRRVDLATQVSDFLRERIAGGYPGFSPGSRLNLAGLAKELGVSVTPVREALKHLETEGLVVNHPHRGAFIGQLSSTQIEEAMIVRHELELLALKLRVGTLKPGEVRDLNGLLREWKDAIGAGDLHRASRAHLDYHKALVKISGNSVLTEIHSFLLGRFVLYTAYQTNADMLSMDNWRLHHDLLEALADDWDRVRELMDIHLQNARRVLLDEPHADRNIL